MTEREAAFEEIVTIISNEIGAYPTTDEKVMVRRIFDAGYAKAIEDAAKAADDFIDGPDGPDHAGLSFRLAEVIRSLARGE